MSNKFLKDEEGKYVEAERPMKYAEIISAEEWDNFVVKRRNKKFHVMSINYGIIQLLSYLVLICLKLFYPGSKRQKSEKGIKTRVSVQKRAYGICTVTTKNCEYIQML